MGSVGGLIKPLQAFVFGVFKGLKAFLPLNIINYL